MSTHLPCQGAATTPAPREAWGNMTPKEPAASTIGAQLHQGSPNAEQNTSGGGPAMADSVALKDGSAPPECDGARAKALSNRPGPITMWWCQFDALFFKCAEILVRKWGALLMVLLSPVGSVLLLQAMKTMVFEENQREPFPNSIVLAPIDSDGRPELPECAIFDLIGQKSRMDCIPLAYTWSGGSSTRSMAEAIINNIGAPPGYSRENAFQMFDSPDQAASAIFHTPGFYDAVLVVESSDSDGLSYTLWKNDTAEGWFYPKDGQYHHYAHVQQAIEQAAMKVGIASMSGDGVSITLRKLPSLSADTSSEALVRNHPSFLDESAGTMLIIGLSISVAFTVQLVAQEKRDGLLGLLRMTGLRESTYWLSWFLSLAVLNFSSALLMALVGKTTDMDLFTECDVMVHTFAAWLYMSATCASVLVFAALVKQAHWVQLSMFGTVLFNMLWQSIVQSIISTTPVDFWTANSISSPHMDAAWKVVFFLIPTFHYGKIIQNIYDVTGVEGGRSARQAVDQRWTDTWPTSFDFANIYDRIGWNESVGLSACIEGTEAYRFGCKGLHIVCSNATLTLPPCPEGAMCSDDWECDWFDFEDRRVGSWRAPSVHQDFWILMTLTVLYMILAWYLAQIFSAGTGSSKAPWFVFMPSYWCGDSSQREDAGETVTKERELSDAEGSARLLKLSKSYAETTALKELSLQMHPNEIFCLLGHNGAGKTTTINLLTGLHPPTHGAAFICGYSVYTQMSIIQAIMGVCPQDNVLFEGLTGQSHMMFWGRFKGMSRAEAKKESDRLLEAVALGKVKNTAAGAYSGGMKRRLSIAIASTACPAIVFLDEPTTGLDPLARMRTWDAITELKRDRILCLTTHSMEEADALGDVIGILASAKLRALGTPMFLKGKYGRGYQLSVFCDNENSQDVLKMLRKHLPSSEVISNQSGRITIGVPKRMFHLFPPFFAKLEQDAAEGTSMLKEWGVSASTLEEVFLKVAVQNDSLNAEIEDLGSNELYPGLVLQTQPGNSVMLTLSVAGKKIERVNHVVAVQCEEAQGPLPEEEEKVVPTEDDPLLQHDEVEKKVEEEPVPQQEGMVVQVVVPEGTQPGGNMVVALPGGETVEVQVPSTARPGDTIRVPFQPHNKDQGKLRTGVLPLPAEVASRPSCLPSKQIRALMMKSFQLQRKQWKANCVRCCCVGFMVLINVGLLLITTLLGGEELNFENPCPANYVVISRGYEEFACQRQGTWESWGDEPYEGTCAVDFETPECRESDFTAFLTGHSQCQRYFWSSDNVHSSFFHLRMNQGCWQATAEATNLRTEDCSAWKSCYTTQTMTAHEVVSSSSCPADGGTDMTDACAPREQLPGLCSVRSAQVRTAAESTHAYTNLNPSDDLLELTSSAVMWHDGNGMDDSWFSGLTNNRFYAFPESVNTTWECGSSRLSLREVASIPDRFLELQVAKKDTEIPLELFGCRISEEEAWEFRALGIDTAFLDSKMPYDASPPLDAMASFFDESSAFPDIGFSLLSSDVGAGRASFDIWIYGWDVGDQERADNTDFRLKVPYPYARTVFKLDGAAGITDCTVLSAGTGTGPSAIGSAITALHNGLLTQMGASRPLIKSKAVPLPSLEFPWGSSFRFLGIVTMFLPLLSMIYFPVMTAAIQQERADRNVMAMQMQSLKLAIYWVATYLWNTVLYWSITGTYYILCLVTGAPIFTEIDTGKFILTLFLWGHAQICLATLLASALGQSKLSTLITYAIVLCTVIAAPMVMALSLSSRAWPWYTFLVAPVNFIRSFIIVLTRGKSDYSSSENTELAMAFAFQFFFSTLLFLIGAALHIMIMNELSLGAVKSWCAEFCSRKKALVEADRVMAVETGQALDVDVEEEASRVAAGEEQYTVRVQDLIKVYPNGFQAVKGVSFGIKTGECFGLLGPNGAGKTTVISMLSGSTNITQGAASICGLDVGTQTSQVYQNLGICPQFDIYWREATVQQHLLLFARLKGIEKSREVSLTRNVAEAVGLDGDCFCMEAQKLSGGQRRRMSLAIAMVANPKVLFLDEPSTGLDPQTRQGLWKIVTDVHDGRAIVLTTHSMEEADALCDRIGIMAAGRLRCIGTSLHLKNKFGSGYQLAISLDGAPRICASTQAKAAHDRRLQELNLFIQRNVSKEAKPVLSWKGAHLTTYELPVQDLKVSHVFETLSEAVKRELRIKEWSLNQTSLNEVFLSIAQRAEQDAARQQQG